MMNIKVNSKKSGNFASDSKMKLMIVIESKRKSLESLKEKYPDAMIIDVTSKAQDEFVKFSPDNASTAPCTQRLNTTEICL